MLPSPLVSDFLERSLQGVSLCRVTFLLPETWRVGTSSYPKTVELDVSTEEVWVTSNVHDHPLQYTTYFNGPRSAGVDAALVHVGGLLSRRPETVTVTSADAQSRKKISRAVLAWLFELWNGPSYPKTLVSENEEGLSLTFVSL